jgi:hypothetical protein
MTDWNTPTSERTPKTSLVGESLFALTTRQRGVAAACAISPTRARPAATTTRSASPGWR